MSIRATIKNPMELSSNFVLSCESNFLVGNVGDKVPLFTDNSGAGNHMVNAVTTSQPKIAVDAQGFKYLNFEAASGDILLSTNSYAQQSTGITLIIVANVVNAYGGTNAIIRREGIGTANQEDSCIFRSTLNTLATKVNGVGVGTSEFRPSIPYTQNNKFIYGYRRDSVGNISIYQNGFFSKGLLSLLSFDSTPRKLKINETSSYTFADINLYQAHVCHEALSDEKLFKLMRYAAFKAGIQI